MKERRGFALAVALVAVVVIAALVTGALFSSSQETHAAAAELLDQQATSYAERAALIAISDWTCPECDAMQVGSVIIRSPIADPPFESTVYITRLDNALYLVTGEGRIAGPNGNRARRRITIAVTVSRDVRGAQIATRVIGQAWSASYQM
ncbi:MAG: hypothetical protein ABI681_08280 [Gemmatimonadales bacterium]